MKLTSLNMFGTTSLKALTLIRLISLVYSLTFIQNIAVNINEKTAFS